MGMFDGVVGGMMGAAMMAMAQRAIEEHGGVQGILNQFEQSGLGHIAQSWVGNGPNQPITADQIEQVLGSDKIQAIAAKTGLPIDQLKQKLAEILPAAVDQMTPNGAVPAAA